MLSLNGLFFNFIFTITAIYIGDIQHIRADPKIQLIVMMN